MKELKITENTLIPLSLAGALLLGMLWLSRLEWNSNANAKDIAEMQDKQTAETQLLEKINIRTCLIAQKLKVDSEGCRP